MTRGRRKESQLSQTLVMAKTRGDRAVKERTSEFACLIFIAGERIGRKLDLANGEILVGRDHGCGLTINNELVSREHAKLMTNAERTTVVDLDSTNGTFVNDETVSERVLRDGDRVAIGKVVMKYLGRGSGEVGYHDEVFRLVSHDGLTDVYNKRFFDEHLASETSTGHGDVSVIVLDADHFKSVNDTHGHAAGDAVLRQLATCARSCVYEGSYLARVGGEEFSVLMPGAKLEEATATAHAIRSAVSDHVFSFGELTIPVTVSVGVAHSPAGANDTGQALFRRADEKLYEAKLSGRNRVCN